MATIYEEFKVQSRDLVDKVRSFMHEGNVRRIVIKDEKGHTFLEIPLTIAAIGVIASPVLAGVGALAALVANFTLVVERKDPFTPAADAEKPAEPEARPQ
jgi:hypothetical protein